jgi:phage terminase large subunit
MPTLQVNKKLEKFLTTGKQIKVAIGGRGSGKSIGIGDMLTLKMDTEAADIYCLREFQDSINDSVHRVFEDSVTERLGLSGWDIQKNTIAAPSGAHTVYRGAARNPDSIQSAQGFKYSWFEEAHKMSQASIDKLLPTILRNPGAECWFSANPQSQADPFSQRFIVPYQKFLDRDGYYEDDLHLIVVINWRDNPWWNKEQEALRAWDRENLPRAKYDWIWEGCYNDEVDGSIIKAEWFDAAIDAHKIPNMRSFFKPRGAVVLAHDPSDTGNDDAGLAIRHGSIIERVSAMSRGEVDEKCDWATDTALSQRCDWFLWDGDGMGTGLKRQVADAFEGTRTKWHMFKGSLSGSGQDNAEDIYMKESGIVGETQFTYAETFKNNRSQYYIDLADRFYNTYRVVVKGEYADVDEMISLNSEGIDNIAALRSELCRIPRKPNPGGLEQIMSKQDMAKLQISSPNMADSVMMTMWKPKTRTASRTQARRFVQQSTTEYDAYNY